MLSLGYPKALRWRGRREGDAKVVGGDEGRGTLSEDVGFRRFRPKRRWSERGSWGDLFFLGAAFG